MTKKTLEDRKAYKENRLKHSPRPCTKTICHCKSIPGALTKSPPKIILSAINQQDWEKEFDNALTDGNGNWNPIIVSGDTFYIGGDVDKVKDFIRTNFISKSELKEKIGGNYKGTFTDDAGHDCWYIKDLLKELGL